MSETTVAWRPRRSALFLPASNPRAIEKARSLDCDVIIFDLEDSVAPQMRPQARENLVRLVAGSDFGAKERVIRLSALEGTEFTADVDAALACSPDALLLPKVETPDSLRRVREAIGSSEPALWAMIETPLAVLDCREIAASCRESGLAALVIGPNDLAKSTGVALRPGRQAMLPWIMHIIASARAYGIAVLDGVYNNFRDAEGFAQECRQAAELGLDGKTLIHPGQIAPANAAFSPDAQQLERARRIVELYSRPENAALGAAELDGEMVERLHLDMARRLLAMFGGDR